MTGAMVAVAIASATTLVSLAAPATASEPFALGGSPGQRGAETKLDALTRFEAESQRRVAVVRAYARWDTPWPDVLEDRLAANGQIEHLSVKPRYDNPPPGVSNVIPWRSIADAQPGSTLYADLVGWADRVKAYGRPILFTFHHEPEGDTAYGTSADFVDAWRRVVDIFRQQGASNASFVWTMTAGSFSRTDSKAAPLWYPGDDSVDDLGVDGYNFYGCRGGTPAWKTVGEIFQPFLAFAADHPSESLVVAELGSIEDPADPSRKAAWLADAEVTFQQPAWSRLVAIEYWNSQNPDLPDCGFWLDSTPAALSAWQSMASDPAYSATTISAADASSSAAATVTPTESASPTPSPTASPSPSPVQHPPATPGQPTGASNDASSIDVSWPASTDPDGGTLSYRVYRDASTAPVATMPGGSSSVVSYHDAPLASGSSHTYAVEAVDPEGNVSGLGPASAPIVVRSAPSQPGTPSALSTTTTTIDLAWTAASDADDVALTYQVYRDAATTPVASVAGATSGTVTYRDAGLEPGTFHSYSVRAVDAAGDAGPMSGVSAPVATLVFTDAFGSLAAWPTRSGTATLDTATAPPAGGAAPTLRLTAKNAAAYARHGLGTPYPSVCVQAAVDVSSISKKQATLVAFRTASAGIGRVLVDPASKRLVVRSDVSSASTSSATPLPLGVWSTIDACVTTGSTGSWTVRLNGTTVIGPWTANNGSSAIATVQLGDESPRTFVANVDDVIVRR